MSRAGYSEAIIDSDGDALQNINVSVYQAGTSNLATIYSSRTGGAKANPFATGLDGVAAFFAETGDYDIKFEDSQSPARVATRTFGWVAPPAGSQSIPTSMLADNAITSEKILAGAVGSAALADGAVTPAKMQGQAAGRLPIGQGSSVAWQTPFGDIALGANGEVIASLVNRGALQTANADVLVPKVVPGLQVVNLEPGWWIAFGKVIVSVPPGVSDHASPEFVLRGNDGFIQGSTGYAHFVGGPGVSHFGTAVCMGNFTSDGGLDLDMYFTGGGGAFSGTMHTGVLFGVRVTHL